MKTSRIVSLAIVSACLIGALGCAAAPGTTILYTTTTVAPIVTLTPPPTTIITTVTVLGSATATVSTPTTAVTTTVPATSAQVTYSADLSGAKEVPPVTTQMTGHFSITFNAQRSQATYTLTVSNGSGITTAEIYVGAAGTNGLPTTPLFASITGTAVNGTLAQGTLTDSNIVGPLSSLTALAQAMAQGQVYISVNTTANPNGEIRGQLALAPTS